MKVGTKSVLFGYHQFLIHPWFVALAWWKLYGFPFDPRLWVAFFVHDLGYFGKPNMDGPEGTRHPILGGHIMDRLFGKDWYLFTLCHSRHYAKSTGMSHSRLCVADKLAFAITPYWLCKLQAYASGEIHEYMRAAGTTTFRQWHGIVKAHMRNWVTEHADGREDTWTQAREA